MQRLHGVGAGIFGVLTPVVADDLVRGTGRFNLALGVALTMQGIRAAPGGLAAVLLTDQSVTHALSSRPMSRC